VGRGQRLRTARTAAYPLIPRMDSMRMDASLDRQMKPVPFREIPPPFCDIGQTSHVRANEAHKPEATGVFVRRLQDQPA